MAAPHVTITAPPPPPPEPESHECHERSRLIDDDPGGVPPPKEDAAPDADDGEEEDGAASTLASVAGNVLEWYDFAIYGYFSDIIGRSFFPPASDPATPIVESFLVFGGAFLVRPVGGILMGHVGDSLSRKRALELSVFLMAVPTFAMGCLPTYDRAGWWSVALLVAVRLLQGLSAGGQLMTSLVFVAEGRPRSRWGWYGSLAMTSANAGTLLGGICGFGMRYCFTDEQLEAGLWRVPFLCGVLVSASGFYLKHKVKERGKIAPSGGGAGTTPLQLAFSRGMRRSLLCATAAVCLWAGGFYVLFVWLVVFMTDLVDPPVPMPFLVNAASLSLTMVILFPFAGALSDLRGRRPVMTLGAAGVALLSPPLMTTVASAGDARTAFLAQATLGACLCLYGAPLCAFLVESFPPEGRLTSVAVGYNAAMAVAGGLSPAAATKLALRWGPAGAGGLLSVLAVVSLCGVHLAPERDCRR